MLLVKMDVDTYNDVIKLLTKREEQRQRCRGRYQPQNGIRYNTQHKTPVFEVYDIYKQDQLTQPPLQNIIESHQQEIQQQILVLQQLQQSQYIPELTLGRAQRSGKPGTKTVIYLIYINIM